MKNKNKDTFGIGRLKLVFEFIFRRKKLISRIESIKALAVEKREKQLINSFQEKLDYLQYSHKEDNFMSDHLWKEPLMKFAIFGKDSNIGLYLGNSADSLGIKSKTYKKETCQIKLRTFEDFLRGDLSSIKKELSHELAAALVRDGLVDYTIEDDIITIFVNIYKGK